MTPRWTLATLAVVLAAGCGGERGPESAPPVPSTPASTGATSEPSTTEPPAPKPKPKALPGLPAYTAAYTKWTRLNRKPIPPRESGDAHLGTKRVFASKERWANGRFRTGRSS